MGFIKINNLPIERPIIFNGLKKLLLIRKIGFESISFMNQLRFEDILKFNLGLKGESGKKA
jgi:hypothetical protein